MDALYAIFGIVIPYLALITFLAGIIYRVIKWARAPVPFHIPTVCGQQKTLPWFKANGIESPNNTFGLVIRMALEILLFRSLFRNERAELKGSKKLIFGGNRYLWLGGLVFHWSLLIILVRHLRLFTEPVPSFIVFIQNIDGILPIVLPTIFITDALILLALTYLFFRRVVFPQIRYISLPSDYIAVLLLLAVVISGILVRFFFRVDIIEVKELAMGVITLSPSIPEGLGLFFYIHLFLVCCLIAYFPFSKMMHAAGVFLSPTRNLLNNSRVRRHVNPWSYPVKLHTYEEWEDNYREAMKGVGLPLEKE